MVGATGFEPAAPCSQSRCATRLRHAPILDVMIFNRQTKNIICRLSKSKQKKRLPGFMLQHRKFIFDCIFGAFGLSFSEPKGKNAEY